MRRPPHRLRVSGRVQGVGFRAYAVRLAHSCGVRGGVRNERDGSVLAVVEGPDEAIERFREGLATGPPAARVAAVEERAAEAAESDEAFDVTF